MLSQVAVVLAVVNAVVREVMLKERDLGLMSLMERKNMKLKKSLKKLCQLEQLLELKAVSLSTRLPLQSFSLSIAPKSI